MSHHFEKKLRPSPTAHRRGFSLVEVSLAMVVLALLLVIGTPRVSRYMTEMRVQRATAVVATDLEQAFAMAGRQRKPVRLNCTCGSQMYTVTDRLGGTTRLTRTLGADADYKLTTLTFSAAPVDIFPSGVMSAPLTVTVGAGGYSKQVVMTTAGQVRILP
jgi:prepilin-type N-terminal cleavage/methylation domain-containing protein